jgi:hypothetical protein
MYVGTAMTIIVGRNWEIQAGAMTMYSLTSRRQKTRNVALQHIMGWEDHSM